MKIYQQKTQQKGIINLLKEQVAFLRSEIEHKNGIISDIQDCNSPCVIERDIHVTVTNSDLLISTSVYLLLPWFNAS